MPWLSKFTGSGEVAPREPLRLLRPALDAADAASAQQLVASGMSYELAIDSFFGASHAMRPSGETHTHSFRLQAMFVTDKVDENGMICGFREASDLLEFEAKRYVNRFINDVKPFDLIQPTGENLATVIYRNVLDSLAETMPDGPRLIAVRLWENPTSSVRVGMPGAA